MKDTTIELIRTVLKSDETVTPEQIERILRLCRQKTGHRHLVSAKEAMTMLQISRPTLRAYVRNGLLSQINFSSRKIRFDESEVNALLDQGVQKQRADKI